MSRESSPESAKTLSLPADYRIGLNENQRLPPVVPNLGQTDPKQSIPYHPNPEPLQDRFYMLRFKSECIRHGDHDLIVVVPRSSAQRGHGDAAFVGGHAVFIVHLVRIDHWATGAVLAEL